MPTLRNQKDLRTPCSQVFLLNWRRRAESNCCIKVLQTSPLPLGYGAMERETGFEPATCCLGSNRSTTELLPRMEHRASRPVSPSGQRYSSPTEIALSTPDSRAIRVISASYCDITCNLYIPSVAGAQISWNNESRRRYQSHASTMLTAAYTVPRRHGAGGRLPLGTTAIACDDRHPPE